MRRRLCFVRAPEVLFVVRVLEGRGLGTLEGMLQAPSPTFFLTLSPAPPWISAPLSPLNGRDGACLLWLPVRKRAMYSLQVWQLISGQWFYRRQTFLDRRCVCLCVLTPQLKEAPTDTVSTWDQEIYSVYIIYMLNHVVSCCNLDLVLKEFCFWKHPLGMPNICHCMPSLCTIQAHHNHNLTKENPFVNMFCLQKHRKNCECCPGHYLIVNH